MIFMIRQAERFNKIEDATKGVGGPKFDFNKTFRNQLFSHVWVLLYHQYSITNHIESILLKKDKGQTIIYELILPI